MKLGESYYHWGGQWIAEAIERVNRNAGASLVICRSVKFGDQRKISPRYLTPWEDYLAAEKINQIEIKETKQKIEMLCGQLGEGVQLDGEVASTWVSLRFTEAAVERLLEMCNAKPIPADRRPSEVQASDNDEYIKRCSLLGGRLRRALGVGYCGIYTGASLARAGGEHQAKLSFFGEELDQAIAKLGIETPEDSSSALSQLLG